MPNRYVAFGYEITGGKIAVIESEKVIVENIFGLYINQKPLSEIANRMNLAGISYNNDGRSWNKNIVKRIIENRKYLGEDGYPAVIPQSTFEHANRIKEEKVVLQTDENKQKTALYHELLVCTSCGGKLTRYKGSKIAGETVSYWKCRNTACNCKAINEKKLDKMITSIINGLIENPTFTDECHEESNEQSVEEIRLTNEMQNAISDNTTELQKVIDSICKIAELHFHTCKSQDFEAINHKMRKELSVRVRTDKPDIKLIKSIVKTIGLTHEKTIEVTLINGYLVKGGLKNDTECSIPANRD